jgi:hypothetical protein
MWCIGDARSAEWIKLVSKASRDELAMWSEEEIAASWLGDWANRIEFTLDPDLIDEDLTDFPVALKVSDLSGISSVDMTDLFDKLAYPVTGDEFTGDDDDPPNPDLWTIIEGTPSINNICWMIKSPGQQVIYLLLSNLLGILILRLTLKCWSDHTPTFGN